MEKRHVYLHLMVVFDEEKIILRYCHSIEEGFWIVYQMCHQGFSVGGEEGWRAQNYEKSLPLINEFN